MKTKQKTAPQFYYEWGNEKSGYVSTGAYVNDVLVNTGHRLKSEVSHLPFNNPHS